MRNKFLYLSIFLSSLFFLSFAFAPFVKLDDDIKIPLNDNKKFSSNNQIILNVYNSEDYICLDEYDDSNKLVSEGVISLFEKYEREEKGRNVKVIYSNYDTNENMLSQLKMQNDQYDLICTSDYIVQKMIKEDMIIPFEDNNEELFSSTPNYQQYASKFIKNILGEIEVDYNNSKEKIINNYCRGYMWGTLGLLYNTTFSKLEKRDITSHDLDIDMQDWSSLWNDKYRKLLSIKDSMRDTYAIGLLETYKDDFVLDGIKEEGFKTLYDKFKDGTLSEEEYRKKGDRLFNLCDNETIKNVKSNLLTLRDNAYGFEVDSGKSDMAKGQYFAINLAWSGDACWAMEMADDFNYEHEEKYPDDEKFNPTILKYQIPNNGSNIWCDAWVLTKACQKHNNKEVAQDFVDFMSRPDIACMNMDYIGYTSCIAGDDVLSYVIESNDIRYDEEKEEIDETLLDEYNIYPKEEIENLDEEEIEDAIYSKDISYFFVDSLEDYELDDATIYIEASERNRSFDASYPDKEKLPSLFIMKDYGNQNSEITKMWQEIKNKYLPIWVYVIVLLIVSGIISYIIYRKIRKNIIIKNRHLNRLNLNNN